MIKTLRFRLFISHVLPMFMFIPLIGFLLIYFLENQVFLPALLSEMVTEGQLIAQDVQGRPQALDNQQSAAAMIASMGLQSPLRLALLSPDDVLLASSRSEDQSLVGTVLTGLPPAGSDPEAPRWQTNPSGIGQPRLDVVIPVVVSNHQIIGFVRITRYLTDLQSGILQARWWVFEVLLIALVVNTLVGYGLAEAISRPIRRIADSIRKAPPYGEPQPLNQVGWSEIDQVAEAYNRLQSRNYHAELTRKRMIANLVHELGRPLGGLQTAVHALLSGAESDSGLREDLLRGMAERIEHMGVLVNDLALAYQPRETLGMSLNRVRVNPERWVEPSAAIWGETARQAGLEWNCSVPDDLPQVEIDPARMEQALGNLVTNAIKFTPIGGKVALSCGVTDSQLWFRVSDTGIGISLEDQHRLFEPFYRTVVPGWKAPGLGLGLSIAKTIVEAHDGKIELESVPGAGSTFTVFLPLR